MDTGHGRKPAVRALWIAGICLVIAALLLVVYFCSYKKNFLESSESPNGSRTLSVYKVGASTFSGTSHLLVCVDDVKLFDFTIAGNDASKKPEIQWLDEDRLLLSVQEEPNTLCCHLAFGEDDKVTVGWYTLKDGEPRRPASHDLNAISDRVQFEGFTVPDWAKPAD